MFAISRRLYCMPATTNYTLSHVLFIRVGKNEGTISTVIYDCWSGLQTTHVHDLSKSSNHQESETTKTSWDAGSSPN